MEELTRMAYPEELIWYVRASHKDGSPTEGSAVAVRIQQTSNGVPVPNTARTYLLTCAHVLRGKAPSDGKDGYGQIAADSDIRVWPSGVGRTDDQSKSVKLRQDIRNVALGEVESEDRSAVTLDWVVLEITYEDAALASAALNEEDVLDVFAVRTDDDASVDYPMGKDFLIVGYPGGELSHVGGIVTPTRTGPFPFHHLSEGRLVMTGDQTAPGISGGGVFGPCTDHASTKPSGVGVFAGLHRAKTEETIQLQAVSAGLILEHFRQEALPFALSRRRHPPRDGIGDPISRLIKRLTTGLVAIPSRRPLLVVICLVILVAAGLIYPWWPRAVSIEFFDLANPGNTGTIVQEEARPFYNEFGELVFTVYTTPFPRAMTSPQFTLQTSDPTVKFRVMGKIEEEVSGKSIVKGELRIDSDTAATSVSFCPQASTVSAHERVRLLLGVERPDKPRQQDKKFNDGFERSLILRMR
jgi:hypothetical protein